MKKLSCLLTILTATLTSCATTPTLDPQGNYVSPNHTFSIKVPADMHPVRASTNPKRFEYIDLGNGSMPGLEIYQGGIQSVEWISASSPMIPGVYMHDKHSNAAVFEQFERYFKADNQLTSLDVQRKTVTRINGYRAYEMEGIAKQGNGDFKFMTTAIVMPTATAVAFSVLAITNSVFTGASLDAHYQALKTAHHELTQSIQQL